MNIIAVDDERAALRQLERAIRNAITDARINCFISSEAALEYAEDHPVHVAFLDIEMPDINGLTLAKQLEDIHGSINIIFVTGYEDYTIDAFNAHVSGYVMKPINPERVANELKHLRNPIKETPRTLGAYTVDYMARRVYREGKDLLLTPREYNIFYTLASSPGTFFTAQDLYEATSRQTANDQLGALYVHLSNLRKKLGLDDERYEATIDIEHSRGKGYKLIVID